MDVKSSVQQKLLFSATFIYFLILRNPYSKCQDITFLKMSRLKKETNFYESRNYYKQDTLLEAKKSPVTNFFADYFFYRLFFLPTNILTDIFFYKREHLVFFNLEIPLVYLLTLNSIETFKT